VSEINVEHTARDFWATRPRRRAGERKIAGVAAAIGRRYAVDPVLVRVAFVVATLFGGAGLLLYLLGWLLLPVEDDESSGARSAAGRGRGSMSAALTIVLVLLLIAATGAVVRHGGGSGVIGLAVGLGVLLLLHRSRASLGEIPGAPPLARPSSDPAPQTTPADRPTPADQPAIETSADTGEPAPPAWDPLGAAPFAWDLPEPAAPPEPTTQPRAARSKITPVTLGLALLTGGIALAFAPTLSAAQVAAMLLGVIGLGLVAGSFLQGGRGLVPVAIPLALLTWVLSAAPSSDLTVGGRHWDPGTVDQVQPRYSVTLGNGDLDLTRLRLADNQTVRTSVAVGVGETHVLLPPNLDADVTCQTQLGDVYCLGHFDSDGQPSRVTVKDDKGTDGRGGGKLILDVHAGVGQVHVDRAS
jgi:phage shock protein PspC (stress-responsive transcriptional regulator)